MKLIIENDGTQIEALDALETVLSPSTGGVALDRVAEVLKAIREAAVAIRPATMSPQQLETIGAEVIGAANHAYALAQKAPADDPDAQAVIALIDRLGLTPS